MYRRLGYNSPGSEIRREECTAVRVVQILMHARCTSTNSTLDQRDIGMAGDPQARLPEQISGIEGQTRLVMKQPEVLNDRM